jgi:hypothetical protein
LLCFSGWAFVALFARELSADTGGLVDGGDIV